MEVIAARRRWFSEGRVRENLDWAQEGMRLVNFPLFSGALDGLAGCGGFYALCDE